MAPACASARPCARATACAWAHPASNSRSSPRRRSHARSRRHDYERQMRKRRAFEVFTLSFLDCICCGFGAVVLFYTIVQAQAGAQEILRLDELTGEVRKLEEEVLVGQKN